MAPESNKCQQWYQILLQNNFNFILTRESHLVHNINRRLIVDVSKRWYRGWSRKWVCVAHHHETVMHSTHQYSVKQKCLHIMSKAITASVTHQYSVKQKCLHIMSKAITASVTHQYSVKQKYLHIMSKAITANVTRQWISNEVPDHRESPMAICAELVAWSAMWEMVKR